jgi:RNA polymerase sigma factor (sigma-70 family)
MRLSTDQRQLAADNVDWAGHIVIRQAGAPRYLWDDAMQCGLLGLCRATLTFDPSRGAFRYWSKLPIANEAQAFVRRETRRLHSNLTDVIVRRHPAPTEVDPAEQQDAAARVKFALGILGPRQRFVVTRHYGLDGKPPESLTEIGRTLGLTRAGASLIHTQALAAMKATNDAAPTGAGPLRRQAAAVAG